MKKLFILSFAAFIGLASIAQDIYALKESEVKFFSESPLENIDAVNKDSKSFFQISKKTIAIVIPIVKFKFAKPLMEEHFNENYMESEKFSTASFKGEINEDIDYTKDGEYDATATGILTIHGVEQTRTINGKIVVNGSQLIFTSKFQVKLEEHKIDIPSVVVENIAEVVDVTCKFVYEPKK